MDRSNQRRLGQVRPLQAGLLIRELRESVGVTKNKLCAEIGMTLGQLSDIERGIQTVSLRRAYQISEALGVAVDKVVEEIVRDKLFEAGFRQVDMKIVIEKRVRFQPGIVEVAKDEKPQV